MALSGVFTYTLTANEAVSEALDILGIGAQGDTLSGNDYQRAYRSLNLLLKQLQTQGGHLWTETEGALFLVKGQAEYDFSTAKLANTYYSTTTTAAASSGATTIDLTAVTSMSATDNIGIVLSDGTIQWTTVSSISTLTVTLDAALTGDVASGANVYYYDTTTFTPVFRVTDVRRKEADDYEIPVNFDARKDYNGMPNKTETGVPVMAYYSRQEPSGKMYLWPSPSSADYVMTFTYERKLNVVQDNSDSIDIPDYWFNAFIYKLASMLIPKFGGVSVEKAQLVNAMATQYMNEVLSMDNAVYDFAVKVDARS